VTTKTITPVPDAVADALADALALVRKREVEHVEAQAAEAALEIRLRNGDDTVTTEALTKAGNAIRRAGLLLEAARQGLTNTKSKESKAAAVASPDIAELISEVLTENVMPLSLLGVPVTVAESLPTETPDVVPSIVLVQDKATRTNLLTGTIDGECVLGFIYGEAVPLDVQRVRGGIREIAQRERLGDVETFNDAPATSLGGGVELKAIAVRVKGAQPEIPTVTESPAEHRFHAFTQGVAASIKRQAGYAKRQGVAFGSGDSGRYVSNVQASVSSSRVVDINRGSDGVVRRTVEVTITAQAPNVHGDALADRMVRILNEEEGSFASGLGRVESVNVARIEPSGSARSMTVQFVLVSRSAV
jgi:hypothetical protein